jgi:hypothetical protein
MRRVIQKVTMLEAVLLALIAAALVGLGVIADIAPSRLYSSEWRLKRPQHGSAIRR